MGHADVTIALPTDYTDDLLVGKIRKQLSLHEFSYQIDRKSLDARNKKNIHWQIRASVLSPEIKGTLPVCPQPLSVPHQKRKEKVLVVGSGPAGFFSALVLQKAGFKATLIERGSNVGQRAGEIKKFESTSQLNPANNYAFGEGGAGAFSDGKLTSRTKNISKEKQFVMSTYIRAGAPKEIAYLLHPHLGSDNLKKILNNLRDEFLSLGGRMLFDICLQDLKIKNKRVVEAVTNKGGLEADFYIIAPGHSAYDTYRMLMRRGVKFRTKNFAIGFRVEHTQKIINQAQWGCGALPGVKAAEYRLASPADGHWPVYTFCMCPGGVIVPSASQQKTNIVNGMSLYARDGKFANAACVAGIDLNKLNKKEISPMAALDWLETLERKFYEYANGYQAPFCSVQDFIRRKTPEKGTETSYVFGLAPAPLWTLLPDSISRSIAQGLKDFNKKLKGFDTGHLIGLESKTSSPVQALSEDNRQCAGFENLYLIGEGSGYSGGIISSAVHGIKTAMRLIGGF